MWGLQWKYTLKLKQQNLILLWCECVGKQVVKVDNEVGVQHLNHYNLNVIIVQSQIFKAVELQSECFIVFKEHALIT